MRGQPEFALHCAVADYLRLVLPPDVLWTTIGHGGGGRIRGAKLKRMGMKPGVADQVIFWGPVPGPFSTQVPRVLWLELKALKGRLSPEQTDFMNHVFRLGHDYRVCRSIDDVAAALLDCRVPTRAAKVA